MASPIFPASANTGPTLLDDIASAIRQSDFARASTLAGTALSLGIQHPIIFNARALWLQQQGQFREALTEFTRARTLAPNDANVMNAIGVCLINLGQPAEALASFDTALRIDPNNAQAHYRKGWTLEMLGDRAAAEREYEHAIAANPNHADALASLAAAVVTTGNTQQALDLADRALKIDPNQATAVVALALVDLANEEYISAEQRLRAVLDSAQLTARARAVVHGLLADALDGQDRVDEAFQLYKLEKNEFRRLYAQNYVSQKRPREIADTIARCLAAADASAWRSSPDDHGPSGGTAQHVFLLGFSRSGTTLLEQILASHERVAALEERQSLANPAQTYLTSEAGLARLATLPQADLDDHRNAYWQSVRDTGLDIEDKVFVDKLPLNTIKLPLIAKLFPQAKIIFAIRDPRDVVLSCYRRHFEINAAMFEFLALEDTAELYAAVMRLADVCRAKLPLRVHEHRYEHMIADFDSSIAAVCDFIGVEWSNALRDFHANTDLLPVRSPSAAQIKRPLYSDSVRQWHRYKAHLAPVLPLLQPWVEKLGYPPE